MDTSKIVLLETNDSSLLYDICGLYELDNKYFIWSRSMIKVFDKSGKYLYPVSRKGQGPMNILLYLAFMRKIIIFMHAT